ncbi:MAG: SDR family NAD(P)-dependent oxidoreductase [Planctomycetes bacterium]|nr:SDR family NAD(P)-dependent oxidoreductase [Planctomycetota bacterium]
MNALALVTGTTRGIGRAVADALLAAGWDVVGIARGDAPPALADAGATRTCAATSRAWTRWRASSSRASPRAGRAATTRASGW